MNKYETHILRSIHKQVPAMGKSEVIDHFKTNPQVDLQLVSVQAFIRWVDAEIYNGRAWFSFDADIGAYSAHRRYPNE